MSQQFYSSISNYYQYIFPFNPEQVNFLRGVIPFNGAKILDAGCATGELAFALTSFGFPVWGIDSDAEMVEKAKKLKPEDSLFPVFEQLDMRKLTERFPESFFDTILCFGNTLVHLQTETEVFSFLQDANKILTTDGKLSIQILNYQHIIDHQVKTLPIIENEYIRFERSYNFQNDSELIDFNTRLIIKATDQEITNSVQLFALRKDKLKELIQNAGFEILTLCGNFNGLPFTETSLPLIVTCRKNEE